MGEVGCDAAGACTVLSDPARTPPGIRIQGSGRTMSFCIGSECVQDHVSCEGVSVPASILDVISQRPQPPQLRSALEPGLYVEMMLEPGVELEMPDMLEACFSDPTALWPDGIQIGLTQVDTDQGSQYEVVYSETCTPSDDPEWPLICQSEDANVADPDAASSTYRARIVEDPQFGTVIESEVDYEPSPARTAMLLCTDERGEGINLGFDPRGAILLNTLDELRPAGAPRLTLGR